MIHMKHICLQQFVNQKPYLGDQGKKRHCMVIHFLNNSNNKKWIKRKEEAAPRKYFLFIFFF